VENIGLVLEGGGMRGLYTTGVLDFFMHKNLYFPYVIGVSMGACNAASYISRQKGRTKRVNINYIDDPRYLSIKNWIKKKGIFGSDFVFDEIPNKIELFDTETFNKAKERFIIVTTDCDSGKPVYFEKSECQDEILDVIKASSSLPFVSPIVKYKGINLLDGGISDPIPVKKSIEDGNNKNVIVLTRNKGYLKKPLKMKFLVKKVYSSHKGLIDSMINRYRKYNDTIKYIEKLEREGKAFVIRPLETMKVKRIEKDKKKLNELYEQGYRDAKNCYENLKKWIESN
jgi:predicted patatin/cPLA2 family phospholipase